MKTIRKDDRTADQLMTHTVLITATDRFMSGWGHAKNGDSKCAWACKPDHADKVFEWVKSRSEMYNVKIVYDDWHPEDAAHVHIYVVHDQHNALK